MNGIHPPHRAPSRRTFSLALTSILASLGCRQRRDLSSEKRLLATTSLAADMAREVAGPDWQIDSLMGPGIDPHTYEPAYGALRRMSRSALVLYHGLHLEGKMSELLERLGERQPGRCQAICAEIPQQSLRGEDEKSHDPHVWMDVSLWSLCPPVVAEALALIDGANAAAYRERSERLVARYKIFDLAVRKELARVPAPKRVLVTAHDAFAYFGRAYGWRVEGVQGISTASEATTGRLEQLARLLVERKIQAIFLESSVSPRTLQRLREITQRIDPTHAIKPGGTLYSDSLGDPGSGAETYEGMMMANVKTLVEALA